MEKFHFHLLDAHKQRNDTQKDDGDTLLLWLWCLTFTKKCKICILLKFINIILLDVHNNFTVLSLNDVKHDLNLL